MKEKTDNNKYALKEKLNKIESDWKNSLDPDDLLTVEEKKVYDSYKDRLYTPEAIKQKFLEIDKQGDKNFMLRFSTKLGKFVSKYRNEFIILAIILMPLYIIHNTGLAMMIYPRLHLSSLLRYTNFDPPPFKLLAFIFTAINMILAQILLVNQRQLDEKARAAEGISFGMIIANEVRTKVMLDMIDSLGHEHKKLAEELTEILEAVIEKDKSRKEAFDLLLDRINKLTDGLKQASKGS